MTVYRLCNELEFQKILNTMSFDDIGSLCCNNSKRNNHRYKSNQKYLHFFKDYDSLFYLYLKSGTYICTYDIPDEILEKYVGVGKYLDRMYMKKIESVTEYSIPNAEISFDYLKSIEKISRDIEYEEYIDDDYKDSLELVYNIQQRTLGKKGK